MKEKVVVVVFDLLFTLIRHQTELFEDAFQTGGIFDRRLFVFLRIENVFKTLISR